MINKKSKRKYPRRRAGLLFLFLALGLILASGGCKKSYPPPNIVLIIVDTLRADKLGCYGFEKEISPEIDAMARDGVLFENVIAQCSWTRPSIASMLTSLYPRSTGIFKEQFDILQDKYLTLAEILKQKGYQTYGVTANPNINTLFNFHQGFDGYRDSNAVMKWMTPIAEKTKETPEIPASAEIFAHVLEQAKTMGATGKKSYIQINVMEVHSPHLSRDEYKDLFKDHPVRENNWNYPQEKLARIVRWTLGAVRQISHDIDSFARKLREIPGWSDTLFIIVSDHGQGLDDHPDVPDSKGHGKLLYESQLMVPMIFWHPGSPNRRYRPHRVNQRVRLLDMMPTILDYAGAPLPETHQIHGVSLFNLITGKGPKPELPEFFTAETSLRKVNKAAVYGQKWKYFLNFDKWPGVNRRELQQVGVTENGKLTDKIAGFPTVAKEMAKLFARWRSLFKAGKRMYPKNKISPSETEQLKALGYLQ